MSYMASFYVCVFLVCLVSFRRLCFHGGHVHFDLVERSVEKCVKIDNIFL